MFTGERGHKGQPRGRVQRDEVQDMAMKAHEARRKDRKTAAPRRGTRRGTRSPLKA